jgi:signal transduction histidine kinase
LTDKKVKSHEQKLGRLLEINQEISATLDLMKLLQSIVDASAELTDSEQASIAQFNQSDESLRFIAARWMDPEIMANTRIPLQGSVSGRAFQSGTAIIVQDAQKDDFYRQVDESSGFQTRSLLAVPMMMHGHATGVLSAVNKENDAQFNDQDIEVLSTLASQAAIAIHNAQLLKESQEAYQRLSELDEMKSNFIAIASHELRIPLGLILGHASFLKEIFDGEQRNQIEVIERNALRLREIVDDLSQFEDLQSDEFSLIPSKIDASALLLDIAKRYEGRAREEKIEWTHKFPSEALYIEGEKAKLQVALGHLLNNALAFTNEGGRVELLLIDEGDWISIQVIDDGVGIAQDEQARIFERFYQVEDHMTRNHGGMGLGLSVAKMMMEMHGGELLVESAINEGSQFTARIPKTQNGIGST